MTKSSNKWQGPQPTAVHLRRVLLANFPRITGTGIYNNRNVAGTKKKSAHAEGRALDIHLDANVPAQRYLGDQIVQVLIRRADELSVHNVIWNQQIWSVVHPTLRPYSGKSPHTDHIHVEFTREGSQYREADVYKALLTDIAIIRTGIEDLQRGPGALA